MVDATGGARTLTESVEEGVQGGDLLHKEVWVWRGERESKWTERIDRLRPCQVDSDVMAMTGGPPAKFLHCLPAHRGEEVTDQVVDGASSRVWPQAANRLHAARGLLVWLLGEADHGGGPS